MFPSELRKGFKPFRKCRIRDGCSASCPVGGFDAGTTCVSNDANLSDGVVRDPSETIPENRDRIGVCGKELA